MDSVGGPSPARSAGPRGFLFSILLFSVLARVAVAWYLGDTVRPLPGIHDEISYHTLALRVVEGHGFSFATGWWPATPANEPTAHWSYLYTVFLAAIYGAVGPHPVAARMVQAIAVGILQPLLTYRVSRRLFGVRAGLVSAAIVAGYAYFVYYSAALVTEALYIVAILWSVDIALRLASAPGRAATLVHRRTWAALGVSLAAAILLRQLFLLVALAILAWTAARVGAATQSSNWWRPNRGWPWRGLAISGAVIALSIAPWTIRNYRVFHEFVPLNTNAGFAFFWGNHQIHGTRAIPLLPAGEYGRLIPSDLRGLNEAQLDRALLQRGVRTVIDDPLRYALLSASRAEEYFKFWPSRGSSSLSNWVRVLSFGLCLPFLVLGIALVACNPHRRVPGTGLLLAIAAVYTVIHLLTWTLIRYRLPVDALLIPFAGLSIVSIAEYLPLAGANNRVPVNTACSHSP